MVELAGGGSVINGATPSSLFRLTEVFCYLKQIFPQVGFLHSCITVLWGLVRYIVILWTVFSCALFSCGVHCSVLRCAMYCVQLYSVQMCTYTWFITVQCSHVHCTVYNVQLCSVKPIQCSPLLSLYCTWLVDKCMEI